MGHSVVIPKLCHYNWHSVVPRMIEYYICGTISDSYCNIFPVYSGDREERLRPGVGDGQQGDGRGQAEGTELHAIKGKKFSIHPVWFICDTL